jgi:hypothetical protein
VFDCIGMQLPGIVGKPGTLVHCIYDLQVGRLLKEAELPNDMVVVPNFFSWNDAPSKSHRRMVDDAVAFSFVLD